jgi:uncharacterized membrane protein YqhA
MERMEDTKLTEGTKTSDSGLSHRPLMRLLGSSRYLVILAVVGSFASAVCLLVYTLLETVATIAHVVSAGELSQEVGKSLAFALIELVDLMLLGTVFIIIALGLYELFIDDRIPLPSWLQIHDLDDLKHKLAGVVVVVMGVLFLGQVVTWDGERDLLGFGAAVAMVIAALTWFLSGTTKKHG